ncbi:MAG: hypothetical protein U0324_42970 [Polyangiales bacterium]
MADEGPPARPPWRAFEGALSAFRFDAVEPALRAHCAERAGRTARQGGAQGAFRARVEEVLRPSLGCWYGARAWSVVGDAFAFRRGASFAPVDQLPNAALGTPVVRVDAAVAVLRERVALLLAPVRLCAPAAGAVPGVAACVPALERCLAALDRASPREDAWRGPAADLAAWTLEARGVSVREGALVEAVWSLPAEALASYFTRYEAALVLAAAGSGAPREAFVEARPWEARLLRPDARGEAAARAAVAGSATRRRRGRCSPRAGSSRPRGSTTRRATTPSPGARRGTRRTSPRAPASRPTSPASGAPRRSPTRPSRGSVWGAKPAAMRRWFIERHHQLSRHMSWPAPLATIARLTAFYTWTQAGEEPYDLAVWRDAVAERADWLRLAGVSSGEGDGAVVLEAAEALRLPAALADDRDVDPASVRVARQWAVGRCWSALRRGGLRLPTREEAARFGAQLPSGAVLPAGPDGAPARLSDLADPFEPLRELWSLGYALRGMTWATSSLVAALP